jgi:hypothetical protein
MARIGCFGVVRQNAAQNNQKNATTKDAYAHRTHPVVSGQMLRSKF